MSDDYGFYSWLDDSHDASEILDMVAEIGYADTLQSLKDDYYDWIKCNNDLDENDKMTLLVKSIVFGIK